MSTARIIPVTSWFQRPRKLTQIQRRWLALQRLARQLARDEQARPRPPITLAGQRHSP